MPPATTPGPRLLGPLAFTPSIPAVCSHPAMDDGDALDHTQDVTAAGGDRAVGESATALTDEEHERHQRWRYRRLRAGRPSTVNFVETLLCGADGAADGELLLEDLRVAEHAAVVDRTVADLRASHGGVMVPAVRHDGRSLPPPPSSSASVPATSAPPSAASRTSARWSKPARSRHTKRQRSRPADTGA